MLLLHGSSDSRLTGRVVDAAARRTGVRLVVPDRPGTGGSTGRLDSLADTGAWVSALADALGLARVPVLGVSGGGPFTLAAARFAPHGVECVVVVSGLGPPELGYAGMRRGQRLSIAFASRAPGSAAVAPGLVARRGRLSPSLFLRLVGLHSSATDSDAVRDAASVETIVGPSWRRTATGRRTSATSCGCSSARGASRPPRSPSPCASSTARTT